MDEYGSAYALTGSTGTMAASLAANSLVFSMGSVAVDATKPNIQPRGPIVVTGFRMVFTAIVGSAATLLAGRALRLFKSSDAAQAAPTGGTALTAIAKRTLNTGADSGLADARIATTAGLTAGAFTRGTVPLLTLDLVGEGAAGARIERDYFSSVNCSPIYIDPGEFLVLSNPAAFDALLTWQLTVDVDFFRRDTR